MTNKSEKPWKTASDRFKVKATSDYLYCNGDYDSDDNDNNDKLW